MMQLICADMPSVYSVSPKLKGPITGATEKKHITHDLKKKNKSNDEAIAGAIQGTGRYFRMGAVLDVAC